MLPHKAYFILCYKTFFFTVYSNKCVIKMNNIQLFFNGLQVIVFLCVSLTVKLKKKKKRGNI